MRPFVALLHVAVTLGCGPPAHDSYDFDGDGHFDEEDCAPDDPSVFASAPDPFDALGLDTNCDGVDGVDGDADGHARCEDASADDDGASEAGECDCNDADAAVNPAATEIPDNETDENCDGIAAVCDADADGIRSLNCGGPDCDDRDATCSAPDDCLDEDGDGARRCDADCADLDPNRAPGSAESCDGVDNDCVDGVPASELDEDGDGERPCASDCDDSDPSIPGEAEVCDGKDSDCDPLTTLAESDADGDGDPACSDCDDDDGALDTQDRDGDLISRCAGDCDDLEPTVRPGGLDPYGDGSDGNCDGIDGVDADGDGLSALGTDCDDADAACTSGPACTDADGDGYRGCDGDCDDGAASAHPGAVEACDGLDSDCDGAAGLDEADLDLDLSPSCSDCDDDDPTRDGRDQDGDGATTCDLPPDCDDTLPQRRPGLADGYGDGLDGNCDGVDGVDADGDGLASVLDCDDADPSCGAEVGATSCDDADLDGFRVCDGDCEDGAPAVHPGAPVESCDGLDTDCDGALAADEVDGDGDGDPFCSDCDDTVTASSTLDIDGDLHSSCDDDCDDLFASTHPGAPDGFGDGVDSNCDGEDGVDADGDGRLLGFDDCDDADGACGAPASCLDSDGDGYRVCDGDCADGRPALHPDATTESCDGFDGDCVGGLPPDEVDLDLDGDPSCSDCDDEDADRSTDDRDGDGQTGCEADCNDLDNRIYAGAPDGYGDGADDNCDGIDGVDADQDGLVLLFADCDDTNPTCGAAATCLDADGDGFRVCDGDCRDDVATAHPGGDELAVNSICDGADSDCDGILPSDEVDGDADGTPYCADCDDDDNTLSDHDTDGDGFTSCAGDCDDDNAILDLMDRDLDGATPCDGDCSDYNPIYNPFAAELCDGLDNDCDTVVPTTEADSDLDGFALCEADCDDTNALVYPTRVEDDCDGLDADCVLDPLEVDDDGDGSLECAGDCDDADALLDGLDVDGDGQSTCGIACIVSNVATRCLQDCDDFQALTGDGFAESCDAVDNSCDGVVPQSGLSGETDGDGDGWVECDNWIGSVLGVLGGGDCNDQLTAYNPAQPDICDGLDTNCNGLIDEVGDWDGDGFCVGDCDDADPNTFPGHWSDVPGDGVDQSCDGSDAYLATGSWGWTGWGSFRIRGQLNTFMGDMNGDGVGDWANVDTGGDPPCQPTWYEHPVNRYLGADQEDPAAGYTRNTVSAYISGPFVAGVRTPDLTGDGLPEFLLTTPYDSPSGPTGFHTLVPSQNWTLGWYWWTLGSEVLPAARVQSGFDMDGDTRNEIVIYEGSTTVRAYRASTMPSSTATGTANLYLPDIPSWSFSPGSGASLLAVSGDVGDLDGDGAADPFVLRCNSNLTVDVLVFHSGTFPSARAVADSEAWLVVQGASTSGTEAVVSGGDWDGDGSPDLWIQATGDQARFYPGPALAAGGTVPGSAGAVIVNNWSPAGTWLRLASQQGDLDGDGQADLVACSPDDTTTGRGPAPAQYPNGGCHIWSGGPILDGPTLVSTPADIFISGTSGGRYGVDPTAGGDVNGDGIADLIAGYGALGPGQPSTACPSGGVRVEVGRAGF